MMGRVVVVVVVEYVRGVDSSTVAVDGGGVCSTGGVMERHGQRGQLGFWGGRGQRGVLMGSVRAVLGLGLVLEVLLLLGLLGLLLEVAVVVQHSLAAMAPPSAGIARVVARVLGQRRWGRRGRRRWWWNCHAVLHRRR